MDICSLKKQKTQKKTKQKMWKMSRWYSTPEHSSAVSTALTAAPVSGGAPAV